MTSQADKENVIRGEASRSEHGYKGSRNSRKTNSHSRNKSQHDVSSGLPHDLPTFFPDNGFSKGYIKDSLKNPSVSDQASLKCPKTTKNEDNRIK